MKFFSYNFFMAKIDELKEELGILKFWLGIVVATILALIGWIATNYQKADWLILVGAGFSIFISICFLKESRLKSQPSLVVGLKAYP
ncbi:hypothetical protein VMZ54_001881 [Campylobacter coli]|nr:hypothetical protein [Campylobacter coli]